MDGRIWLREWLGAYLCVPEHVDELTEAWLRLFVKIVKRDFSEGFRRGDSHPHPTLGDVYYKLLRTLLTEPADLRVVNEAVYLTRGDALRVPLAKMESCAEDAPLATNWQGAFARRLLVDPEHSSYDYRECRWPAIAEECIPRTAMAARFVCQQIRLDYAHRDGGTVALFSLGVYHAVLDAVTRLLVDRDAAASASRIHTVISERYSRILTAWNPQTELYPGCAADSLISGGRRPPEIKK